MIKIKSNLNYDCYQGNINEIYDIDSTTADVILHRYYRLYKKFNKLDCALTCNRVFKRLLAKNIQFKTWISDTKFLGYIY